MTEHDITRVSTDAADSPPWYALHPRHLRFSKFTRIVILVGAILVLLFTVSVKPLWQYGWRSHLICPMQFRTETSATGARITGGGWTRAQHIVVYGAPDVSARAVEAAAGGLRSMVEEIGLVIQVEVIDMPHDARASLHAATVTRNDQVLFDFDRYHAHRLDERGDLFGEMVVVSNIFTDPSWAFGLAHFPGGLAVLQENVSSHALGRHEGAHLLGYNMHDDMPWYIIGYREHLIPAYRDTLMMLGSTQSDALSPRARDALLHFWQGMERRHGMTYFRSDG